MKTEFRAKPTDEELLAAVYDEDPETAASAATVLGLRGDERALDALLALLENPDAEARSAAAGALGLLGLEEAIPRLRLAASDPDLGVASAACMALQRLGDRDHQSTACASLIAELHVEDPERRALAARALGGLMDETAVGPLIETLTDAVAQVRADAAGSLGWLGDARAVPQLMSVGFTDPDRWVREVAMHAVARLVVPETPI